MNEHLVARADLSPVTKRLQCGEPRNDRTSRLLERYVGGLEGQLRCASACVFGKGSAGTAEHLVAGLRAVFGWQSDAELKRIYTGLFQAAMLWLFAIAFGGAALFATEGFSGGVTGSPMEGRIWFGIFGLAIGLFAIMFSIVVLGAIMARNQKSRDAKPGEGP